MPSTTKTLIAALAGAVSVAAHGHVNNIVINGGSYPGYDVFSLPYQSDPAVVVGWSTTATDNGFVAPAAYGTSDIICHKNAKNAGGHAKVAAGDSIYIQWDTWPEGHAGPVLDYLAPCGDSGCETVEKETLKFFKIDEKGMESASPSPGTPGHFASDDLLANGKGWMVKVPENIKAGFYVLRHEIIALHSAHEAGGAQNYPQCFNLEITGSGTEQPEGVLGTALYKSSDPGIDINIYQDFGDYVIPGPKVISGGESVEQHTSAIASSATPITGSALSDPTPDSGSGSGDEGQNTYVPPPTTTLATYTKPTTSAVVENGQEPASTTEAVEPTQPPVNNYPVIPATTIEPEAVSSTEAAEPAATETHGGNGHHYKCTRPKKHARRHARQNTF